MSDTVVGWTPIPGVMLPPGLEWHRAQISLSTAIEAYAPQEMSEWCWAASIQMVFTLMGHPVSQRRIVQEAYGTTVNMPAGSGLVIAEALNRQWTDEDGISFTATVTGEYDADAGIAAISNATLVDSLAHDRPLVIGTTQHAMVLTDIDYVALPQGPYVLAAGVFDPWPGIGARGLTPLERTPIPLGGQLRFVASFVVA